MDHFQYFARLKSFCTNKSVRKHYKIDHFPPTPSYMISNLIQDILLTESLPSYQFGITLKDPASFLCEPCHLDCGQIYIAIGITIAILQV